MSDIVVATPEKLDFALRSDPSVLNDVGVVILDEGHMIGPNEREVRYEAQVQRLLRRDDADNRRIVCLSAVFPSGDDLQDFVAWMTDDDPTGLHKEKWRPTQQKFGVVQWRSDHARLEMTLSGGQSAFIPRYVEAQRPKIGKRKNQFPSNPRELVISTAWRLVEEGQSVLIFCPQRRGVTPYAKDIVGLHQQGFIDTILSAGADLTDARAVGTEWFGADHPILKCLELGVAIHHGTLPGPFRKEVERLLHDGFIKVTVASPTLAQGLNLSASVVLFHGLRSGRDLLTGAQFSNVIGRAGRAFVDTEGLVLYPQFPSGDTRKDKRGLDDWKRLTTGEEGKDLRSGLISVGMELINRVTIAFGSGRVESFLDYVTGGPDWAFPERQGEPAKTALNARNAWQTNLLLLDTSILSIIGDDEADPDQVTQLLLDMLRKSLWERQLARYEQANLVLALRAVVTSRAQYIWNNSTPSQRRGWYLAGVGERAGSALAAVAPDVVAMIIDAEAAIAADESSVAVDLLTRIAELLFTVDTFTPETKELAPETSVKWRSVLTHWLSGRPLEELSGNRDDIVRFIESDLAYRLVWGMEAARVYEKAQFNPFTALLTGTATAAVETGTLNPQAAIIIRSGFDYRSAAIKAVESVESTFNSSTGMRSWIQDLPHSLMTDPDWPTTESRRAWLQFVTHTRTSRAFPWEFRTYEVEDVQWDEEIPDPEAPLRVTDLSPGVVELWSTGFTYLGEARVEINPDRKGALYARRNAHDTSIKLHYRGPNDLLLDMLHQNQ